MNLFSLFKKKIKLHSKKHYLIDKIDQLGLNVLYLKELKDILKKEKKVNRELKQEIKRLSKYINLTLVEAQLDNLSQTNDKQLDILNRIRFKLLRKSNYQKFKNVCLREVEQCNFFSKIIKETLRNLDDFKISNDEFEKERKLIKQIQKTYRELIRSIGDIKTVQEKAKEIILIHHKIKKTKLYEFIKEDIDLISDKAKFVLKNPKQSKLKFLLAGAYIISPGTFELTGVYLFLKYITRYVKLKRSKFAR